MEFGWVFIPCSKGFRPFGGVYCFHTEGQNPVQGRSWNARTSIHPVTWVSSLTTLLLWLWEALVSFETSAETITTWCENTKSPSRELQQSSLLHVPCSVLQVPSEERQRDAKHKKDSRVVPVSFLNFNNFWNRIMDVFCHTVYLKARCFGNRDHL
jgi:hypothetical protein